MGIDENSEKLPEEKYIASFLIEEIENWYKSINLDEKQFDSFLNEVNEAVRLKFSEEKVIGLLTRAHDVAFKLRENPEAKKNFGKLDKIIMHYRKVYCDDDYQSNS